jgi:hypothetical protein
MPAHRSQYLCAYAATPATLTTGVASSLRADRDAATIALAEVLVHLRMRQLPDALAAMIVFQNLMTRMPIVSGSEHLADFGW